MPETKEPSFFADDLDTASYPDLKYRVRSWNDYLALFEEAAPEHTAGEASVCYLYSQVAAERIAAAVPGARIIVMLRHPVDAMYSLHGRWRWSGRERLDFAAALADEQRRVRLLDPRGDLVTVEGLYRRAVNWVPQLDRYLRIFGPDRVHVVLHEDLLADPRETLRGVLGAIGVDPDFETTFETVNANKITRSRLLQRAMRVPPRTVRLAVKRAVPSVVHRLHRVNTRVAPREPLDPQLRRDLTLELGDMIRDLGRMIDRDLEALWVAPTLAMVPLAD